MKKAERTFKENFNHRLRRSKDLLRQRHYFFVRKEHFARADGATIPKRHKPARGVERPYEVREVQNTTVKIWNRNGKEDKISRDRVVLAPNEMKNVSKHDRLWMAYEPH